MARRLRTGAVALAVTAAGLAHATPLAAATPLATRDLDRLTAGRMVPDVGAGRASSQRPGGGFGPPLTGVVGRPGVGALATGGTIGLGLLPFGLFGSDDASVSRASSTSTNP